jgi:alpha-1,3-rhamnosyl/mannosyltransferase
MDRARQPSVKLVPPMRVTVDAAPLLYRSAGVKNYLYHWIRHLLREAGDIEIRLFPFLDEPRALDHNSSGADLVTTVTRLGLMFALNRIPFEVARWAGPRPDVFHASVLKRPPRSARLTATVYDLTWQLMPEMHSPANVAAERVFAERVVRPADRLIAISEATRADAVRILNLAPEKIDVIYPGVAEEFSRAGTAEAEAARARLGLGRPYALFVGTIEPRKNVGLLLDAWAGLPRALRDEFDLVVAGPPGWRQRETLARLRSPAPGVRYLGYVPEPDMPGLVAGATAFVYPSLYEGFGFPVAQAMAAGVPVVTSAVSSLPEIAGGAAELVDPRSPADLMRALQNVLTSPERRRRMIERGRANALRFSWSECARRSIAFFREAAG